MSLYDVVLKILLLLAGLGVFLAGIYMLTEALNKTSKPRLQAFLLKISGSKPKGIAVGAGLTAFLHSSSATTVLAVSLVNAGLLTLSQAAPIIMGANIGTTITAQMLQFSALGLTHWFAGAGAVGMVLLTLKEKPLLNKVGGVLAGAGLIFSGLYLMAHSMEFLATLQGVQNFFATKSNPIVMLLMGMALTAVIQSSTAATGLLIAMVATPLPGGGYLLPFSSAAYAILGMNIGTCVTALLASIGAGKNAVRASLIHILFNVFGALVFLPLSYLFRIPDLLASALPPASAVAMFHTIFNATTTLMLMWFTGPLVKLTGWIVRVSDQT